MTELRRKILITGADGYIGSNLKIYLESRGYEVYALTQEGSKRERYYQVDIIDEKTVLKVIKEIDPSVIIHTAGISSLNQCEKDKDFAWKVNVEGTRNIIEAVKKINSSIKLIFMSSDYVFDGERGDYKESDKLNPKTYYGKTKAESEKDIKEGLENYVICRTANVYGRGGNFFNFVCESLSQGKSIDVFNDVFYTPTYIDYLVNCVGSLLEKDFKGVIHVTGKEKVSRYQFALLVAEAFGMDKNLIKAVKQPDGGLIAKDSSLNSTFSLEYLNNFCPTIEKSLRYCSGDLISPYFYFKDERGRIHGIIRGYSWEEINYVESLKQQVRGNHYHKKTVEGFYIIEGEIKVILKELPEGKNKEFIVTAGDAFMIKPGTLHTFEILEDSKWINMLSKPMGDVDKDIFK